MTKLHELMMAQNRLNIIEFAALKTKGGAAQAEPWSPATPQG